MKLFNGELALVTGAARGNGAAIAQGLADMGARVVLTDLQSDGVDAVAKTITAKGGVAYAYAHDVANPEASVTLAQRIQEDAGDVEILVNNAGVCLRSPFEAVDEFWSKWRTMMEVNLEGILHVSLAFLPALKRTKGRVINIASIASYVATATNPGYPVSKASVKMLTQYMAKEWASHGIRVNAIAPSLVETAMADGIRTVPGRMEALLHRIPLGRVADVHEMTGPVAFLASSLSSYVTGITMPVDGGFLAI